MWSWNVTFRAFSSNGSYVLQCSKIVSKNRLFKINIYMW